MASSLHTFRVQTRPQYQFKSYTKPTEARPSSRRSPPKIIPPSVDEWLNVDETPAIEPQPRTQTVDRVVLTPASLGAKVVNLACSGSDVDSVIGGSTTSGEEITHRDVGSGSVGETVSCCFNNQWSSFSSEHNGELEKAPNKAMNESLNDQAGVDYNSQLSVFTVDQNCTNLDTETNNDQCRPQDDSGTTQIDNQYHGADTLLMGRPSRDSSLGNTGSAPNSQIFPRADSPVSLSQSHEFIPPLRKSYADNLNPRTIRDEEADRTIRLASEVSIPSHFIDSSTISQQHCMTEEKAKKQNLLPASENKRSSSDSHSTSNSESDNINGGNCARGTPLAQERKSGPPANTLSRKRRGRASNTTPDQYLESFKRPAKRRKPSVVRTKPVSSHRSIAKSTLGSLPSNISSDSSDESSNECRGASRQYRINERAKSTASRDSLLRHESKRNNRSVQTQWSNTTLTPSTYASSQDTRKARLNLSTRGFLVDRTHECLPDIAIYPLSTDIAFLTAFVRDRGDVRSLSTERAIGLLKNVVSHSTKLQNTTIKPLVPGIYLLTCFVVYPSDTSNCRSDRPSSTVQNLPSTRPDAIISWDDQFGAGDDDEGFSQHDNHGTSESNGEVDSTESDDNNQCPSDDDDAPPSSSKYGPWSKEEEARLRQLKEKGHPWDYICNQFPNRTPGATKVRWYTRLK